MQLNKLSWNKWTRSRGSQFFVVIFFLFIGVIFFFVQFLSTTYTTVFLFQNADEVRATGGFLGSLLIVQHRGLKILTADFHDVYDLDSQIPNFPSAPAGVRDYLTGGSDQLHLQDANWERDFPTSCAQISELLVAAKKPRPDIMIAVNSTLVEDFLAQTTLTFTDSHGQPLTRDNFSTLARQDHKLTAVNRQPKTAFQRQFAQQLKNYWQNTSWRQRLQLINFVLAQIRQRHLQFYARQPSLQAIFRLSGASGQTRQSRYQQIYSFPSNVGINKANHHTSIDLSKIVLNDSTLGESLVSFTTTITNDNPLDETAIVSQRLHFANYHRLLLPPGVTVRQLQLDGEPLAAYDTRALVDSSGNTWTEIGFLWIINEQTTSTLQVQLAGKGRLWRVDD